MLLKRVNNLCAQDKKRKENVPSGVPYPMTHPDVCFFVVVFVVIFFFFFFFVVVVAVVFFFFFFFFIVLFCFLKNSKVALRTTT